MRIFRSEITGEVLLEREEPTLAGAQLPRCYLEDVVFRNEDLSGANLAGANLSHADLRRSVLRRTNLAGASLSGANLFGADLNGAILSLAELTRANLMRADLSGAVLHQVWMNRANLRWCIAVGADAPAGCFAGAKLTCANLSDLQADSADFRFARGRDVCLAGALLRKANFSRAVLPSLVAPKARFLQADLSEADLGNADLSGADLREANLRGCNLSLANLEGAVLTGAQFDGDTHWPLEIDALAQGAIQVSRPWWMFW